MKIQKENIGEILQQIYDSEIHICIGWFWDGGVDFLERDNTMDIWAGLDANIMRGTGDTDMCQAFEKICRHLVVIYPKSSFTEWFLDKFGNKF